MILSLQGCMAAGKTTAVDGLTKDEIGEKVKSWCDTCLLKYRKTS